MKNNIVEIDFNGQNLEENMLFRKLKEILLIQSENKIIEDDNIPTIKIKNANIFSINFNSFTFFEEFQASFDEFKISDNIQKISLELFSFKEDIKYLFLFEQCNFYFIGFEFFTSIDFLFDKYIFLEKNYFFFIYMNNNDEVFDLIDQHKNYIQNFQNAILIDWNFAKKKSTTIIDFFINFISQNKRKIKYYLPLNINIKDFDENVVSSIGFHLENTNNKQEIVFSIDSLSTQEYPKNKIVLKQKNTIGFENIDKELLSNLNSYNIPLYDVFIEDNALIKKNKLLEELLILPEKPKGFSILETMLLDNFKNYIKIESIENLPSI